MASVAIAKLIFVQLPVKRDLFPSKLAVVGETEPLLVAMESTGPVTVETKELDPMPIFMGIVELDIAGALVDTEPEPNGPRMIELVSPSGEQPTKDGAVSLTVAHSWILNNIASSKLSGLFETREGSLTHFAGQRYRSLSPDSRTERLRTRHSYRGILRLDSSNFQQMLSSYSSKFAVQTLAFTQVSTSRENALRRQEQRSDSEPRLPSLFQAGPQQRTKVSYREPGIVKLWINC